MRFKLITEAFENAYMLRNDGKFYKMTQHIYGAPDCFEETLFAAEWLYYHTQYDQTKKDIIRFISSWVSSESFTTSDDITPEKRAAELHMIIDGVPYKLLTHDFVDEISSNLIYYEDENDLNNLVCEDLNQEFCRARYGGLYNSSASSREMVFRISSKGFNWFNIIWQFVYDMKDKISSVTIVRDEESTGKDDFYTHNGETFNAMPIDDFITLSGKPYIESLNEGYIFNEPKNLARMLWRYNMDRYNESLELFK